MRIDDGHEPPPRPSPTKKRLNAANHGPRALGQTRKRALVLVVTAHLLLNTLLLEMKHTAHTILIILTRIVHQWHGTSPVTRKHCWLDGTVRCTLCHPERKSLVMQVPVYRPPSTTSNTFFLNHLRNGRWEQVVADGLSDDAWVRVHTRRWEQW